MTSTEPSPSAPDKPGDAALAEALTTEYGVIYGYGMVSAHSPPDINYLVADALHQHRDRRDQVVTMLADRSVTVPVAAAGYQLPVPVNNPTEAAQLAARMENDAAVAWRAVLEHAQTSEDRAFAVTALTQSAVLGARWNRALDIWPIAGAFPGGSE
ncbi:ferritin-like domain-containing protein [Mycobacterium sp. pUA109]|uniref:ferritin-like domain-containing protein n=1 Tax=Mycobacterium sp. pUA109 TaxID=3238982 RepID=UPI00351BE21A